MYLQNTLQISLLYFTSTPAIPVQINVMPQDHQNSLLSPCFLFLNLSPTAAWIILFKCKSSHVIPLLGTHQWLPNTVGAMSKILACPTNPQSSSWLHLWSYQSPYPLHHPLPVSPYYSFLLHWLPCYSPSTFPPHSSSYHGSLLHSSHLAQRHFIQKNFLNVPNWNRILHSHFF